MVRKRCGMSSIDALTLWKWRNRLLLNKHYSLKNRMESLFTEDVACLIVTSCDVESIDEFVCEKKWSVDSVVYSYSPPITWVWKRNHANLLSLDFLTPIHSTSLLYHLHRLALESRNCNHHHSLSFSSNCNPYSIHLLIPIKWTHSNSSQWSLFYRIHPISTLVCILFTMQWSILMNNPTPKSIIQLLSETILFHSIFSITLLPTQSNLIQWKSYMWSLNHHLLSNG